MIHTIPISQTARAMGVEEAQLQSLLTQCGIQTQEGSLTQEQLRQLMGYLEHRQEETRQRAQSNLERLVQQYVILLDTCSLLHPQFPRLLEHMVPLLLQHGKALVVPSGVAAELDSLRVKKPELTENIRLLLPQLSQLQRQGLLRVYGGASENFGDRQLLAAATHFMTSTSLLVVTQDNALSRDLLHLNQLDSVQ